MVWIDAAAEERGVAKGSKLLYGEVAGIPATSMIFTAVSPRP